MPQRKEPFLLLSLQNNILADFKLLMDYLKGCESLGCSAWRKEGSEENLEPLTLPYKKGGDRIFIRACNKRTRDTGFKLKEGRVKTR